jgi:hypothetical protein
LYGESPGHVCRVRQTRASCGARRSSKKAEIRFFFFFFTEHLLQIPTSAAAAEALFVRGQNLRKPWEEESQQQQQQQMSLSFSPAKA